MYVRFEESAEQLVADARGYGFELGPFVEEGLLDLRYTPLPDVNVEEQLVDLQARVIGGKVKRAVIDSLTMLFHNVVNADVVREHVYSITTLFKNAGCTALLHTDPPAGSGLISRFGVEESIMDGVIVLRLTRERGQRRRTVEVYKMRGVNHASGENPMKITSRGTFVFPRMEEVPE